MTALLPTTGQRPIMSGVGRSAVRGVIGIVPREQLPMAALPRDWPRSQPRRPGLRRRATAAQPSPVAMPSAQPSRIPFGPRTTARPAAQRPWVTAAMAKSSLNDNRARAAARLPRVLGAKVSGRRMADVPKEEGRSSAPVAGASSGLTGRQPMRVCPGQDSLCERQLITIGFAVLPAEHKPCS